MLLACLSSPSASGIVGRAGFLYSCEHRFLDLEEEKHHRKEEEGWIDETKAKKEATRRKERESKKDERLGSSNLGIRRERREGSPGVSLCQELSSEHQRPTRPPTSH